MKIIVVAGPAGCGKSAWARHLANIFGCERLSSDDFIEDGIKWEDVPGAMYEEFKSIETDYPDDSYVVVEGVRALSFIKHNNLKDRVAIVWWGEHDPDRPNCKGLLSRQQDLLQEMSLEVRHFPWIAYP